MDYEMWLNEAIGKTESITPNTVFLLKELFDGVKWNTLANGERRELGRLFKLKVKRGQVMNVEYYDRAQNNSARYIKKGMQ